MYWEEYFGQDPADFTKIQIGNNTEWQNIYNLEQQVAEARRRFGKNVTVRVGREVDIAATV